MLNIFKHLINFVAVLIVSIIFIRMYYDVYTLENRVKTNEAISRVLGERIDYRTNSLQDRLEPMIDENAVKIDNLEYILGRK